MWSWPQREQIWAKPELRPMLSRFSPDGALLAVLGRGRAGGLMPGYEITVFEAKTGKQLWQESFAQLESSSFPHGLAFVGNDLLVVSVSKAGPPLRAFRAKSGESVELPELGVSDQQQLASASDAPVLLAYSNINFDVFRLDKRGQLQRLFGDAPKSFMPLYGFRGGAVSPDGKSVLMTTAEECRVYRVENGEQRAPVKVRGEEADFLADGRTAVIGFSRALTTVSTDTWTARNPQERLGHVSRITKLSFSPDSKLLSSTDGETLLLWNTESGAAVARIPTPTPERWIESIAFHPREPLLYANTGAETWWWDYSQVRPAKSGLPIDAAEPTHMRVMHMPKPPDQILAATISLDSAGHQMVRTTNGFAHWLDLGPDPRENALRLRQLTLEGWGPREPIREAMLSPDGKRAILTGYGVVRIYEFEPDRLVREIKASGAILSPDGRFFATRPSGREKEISVRDLESGAVEATLQYAQADATGQNSIGALTWSPDSMRLAGAAYEQYMAQSSLVLWDLKAAKRLATRPTHRGRIDEIAISADGRQIATANADGAIELWTVSKVSTE
jgi:WD40 repeat protein